MIRKKLARVKNPSDAKRYRRQLSIRKKVSGTAERPRVVVGRSTKNFFIQVIDDEAQKTLFSVQTFGKNAVGKGSNKESAKAVGTKVASDLKAKNLSAAVFDRSGHQYTGAVAALADAIRENGIKI
jgi:large subunit ribosomal protein L18